jgi:ElaB/YqjD/DUF883 family membrane-anchored ribosome-binding protein
MVTAIAPDVATLQNEIERLEARLDAAVAEMHALRKNSAANGHDKDSILASAEKMWLEVKRQVEQVGHEIEERPMVSALTAFGAGFAIGMLFTPRRG